MKRLGILVPALVFVLGLGVAIVPHVVRAEDTQNESTQKAAETQQKNQEAEKEAAQKAAEQAREQAAQLAEQRKEAEQHRTEAAQKAEETALEAEKKQTEAEKKAAEAKTEAFKTACENKRESYKTRMEAVITNAQRRVDSLNGVVDRVKAYVTTNNLSVADYAGLLTAIETQKALALSIANTAKEAASQIDCSDSTTAQNSLSNFSDIVKQEVSAIESYKTAIKNLVAAVKTAATQATTGGTTNAQ
jgi:hypothetical protein